MPAAVARTNNNGAQLLWSFGRVAHACGRTVFQFHLGPLGSPSTPRHQHATAAGGGMLFASPGGNNNPGGVLPSPHVATADLLSLETGADDSFAAAINDSFAASAWATAVHHDEHSPTDWLAPVAASNS